MVHAGVPGAAPSMGRFTSVEYPVFPPNAKVAIARYGGGGGGGEGTLLRIAPAPARRVEGERKIEEARKVAVEIRKKENECVERKDDVKDGEKEETRDKESEEEALRRSLRTTSGKRKVGL